MRNISRVMIYWLAVSSVVLLVSVGAVFANTPVPAGSVGSPGGGGGAPTSTGAAAATGAAAQAPAPEAPGIGGMLLPILLMFGVVYFLMIRPQQKRMKQQQNMLGQLKHGDEVVTSSGILGKITGITEKVVTLEIASNCKIKILKSQIAQTIKGSVKDIELAPNA